MVVGKFTNVCFMVNLCFRIQFKLHVCMCEREETTKQGESFKFHLNWFTYSSSSMIIIGFFMGNVTSNREYVYTLCNTNEHI